MIEQRLIGSLTELYINGGGYLTEAYPTNFHTFATRKVLYPGDSADRYREVTEAEKATIEKNDAAWVEPDALLIKQWNEAFLNGRYGRYNPETGYFEGNGLVDITTTQAIATMMYGKITDAKLVFNASSTWKAAEIKNLRTTLPVSIIDGTISFPELGWSPASLETIRFGRQSNHAGQEGWFVNSYRLRSLGAGLRAIYDWIKPTSTTAFIVDRNDSVVDALETIYLYQISQNILCKSSPKLTLESFRFMVDNAINTLPITITVHAEVFAKFNDPDQYPEWVQLAADAVEKQISFAKGS